jgi:hypothetical protein
MRRMVAFALGGIALLGLLSVVAVLLVTREPSPAGPAGGDASPPPAEPTHQLLRPPSLGPPPPPGGPPMITAPLDYGPQPPPPPPGSWEAVKPVARPSALGPLGAALAGELTELQPDLTHCYSEEAESRFGPNKITATSGADLEPAPGRTTVLMLEIEASGGQARIVDAPVETRGGASNGTIACAQHLLRGKALPAAGVGAQTRYKMPFSLMQQ